MNGGTLVRKVEAVVRIKAVVQLERVVLIQVHQYMHMLNSRVLTAQDGFEYHSEDLPSLSLWDRSLIAPCLHEIDFRQSINISIFNFLRYKVWFCHSCVSQNEDAWVGIGGNGEGMEDLLDQRLLCDNQRRA